MAHIHLPDGAFSIYWVVIWWAIALVLLVIALRSARKHVEIRRLAIAGMLVAASFAVFQIDIPFAGGVHMNLTPLIGILAGPSLGALIMLLVNILNAFVGHGGWGLIGANTVVNISEVATSFYVFTITKNKFEIFTRGALAAIAGLLVGNIVLVSIIAVSGIQGSQLYGGSLIPYLTPIVLLNLIVAVAEAIVTGFVVVYLSKVRPDLVSTL